MIGGSRSEVASFGAWGRSSPHAPTCRHDRPRPAGPRGSRRGPGRAQPEPDPRQDAAVRGAQRRRRPTTAPTSSSRAIGERQYALAGSYRNGLQIVDITDPEQARIAAVYDCGITQGDPQVFTRGRRAHVRDLHVGHLRRRHVDVLPRGRGARLRGPQGRRHRPQRHVHRRHHRPAGSAHGLLRATSSRARTTRPCTRAATTSTTRTRTSSPRTQPAIEVFDISDFAAPRKVTELALPPRPGLGTESHDITFNESGDRAYSAALSQGVIIDTSDPGRAEHRHQLPRPGDQRLAPVRPVHAHRRHRRSSASS